MMRRIMQIEEIDINGIILHTIRNSNLKVVSSFIQNISKFSRSFCCRSLSSNLSPTSRHQDINDVFFLVDIPQKSR